MIIKLLSFLPFFVLYAISDFISFIACYVLQYRKTVVLENLRNSFPNKEEKELKKLAWKFYCNLSDVIVEMIKSFNMSLEDFRKRVKFNNLEVLTDHFKEGRSVFCMTGHLANWEWILYGFNANCNYPAEVVYKPLTNKSFNTLMLENRMRFGSNPIAKEVVGKEIIRRSRSGVHAFALAADQIPALPGDKYWTTFLEQESVFYTGGENLARLTKSAVVFIGMRRVKRGYYEIDAQPLASPSDFKEKNTIIEAYARALEKYIRKYPSDWLWSHRRWKYTPEEFEKLTPPA